MRVRRSEALGVLETSMICLLFGPLEWINFFLSFFFPLPQLRNSRIFPRMIRRRRGACIQMITQRQIVGGGFFKK